VTPWGKTHTSVFFKVLSTLKKPSHKIRTRELYSNIEWWIKCLSIGNNTRLIWDNRPIISIFSDSSLAGGGVFCQSGDWMYKNWRVDLPRMAGAHINIKELYMGYEAVARWAPLYNNFRLHIFMDNIVSVCWFNRGTSHNVHATECLRSLSMIALKHNVGVEAFYIPGVFNELADSISRFHMHGQIARFVALVNACHCYVPLNCNGYWLRDHMSYKAELCILPQIQKWRALHKSWTRKCVSGSH
jgi:hypothetical protein